MLVPKQRLIGQLGVTLSGLPQTGSFKIPLAFTHIFRKKMHVPLANDSIILNHSASQAIQFLCINFSFFDFPSKVMPQVLKFDLPLTFSKVPDTFKNSLTFP